MFNTAYKSAKFRADAWGLAQEREHNTGITKWQERRLEELRLQLRQYMTANQYVLFALSVDKQVKSMKPTAAILTLIEAYEAKLRELL